MNNSIKLLLCLCLFFILESCEENSSSNSLPSSSLIITSFEKETNSYGENTGFQITIKNNSGMTAYSPNIYLKIKDGDTIIDQLSDPYICKYLDPGESILVKLTIFSKVKYKYNSYALIDLNWSDANYDSNYKGYSYDFE